MLSSTYHVKDDAGAWVPATVQLPEPIFMFPAAQGMWACREYLGRDRPKRHCVARIELRRPIWRRRFMDRSPRWLLLIDGRRVDWERWDRMKPDGELSTAEYRARLVALHHAMVSETANLF